MKKDRKFEREKDHIEYLEKFVRELKSVNRSLLKQLKKISKGINKEEYENKLDELELSNGKKKERKPEDKKCPECFRGNIIEIDIASRKFQRCSICEYKSKVIK